jgi:biopolymer transport protein ExbD/biopolymer transport protein TolR
MSLSHPLARKPVLVRPAAGPKTAINVTPLVDVVLVLLIIFMVVMPLAEKDFDVRIPANEQVQSPDEIPPDQIVVRIEASGQLVVNGQPVGDGEYIGSLKERLGRRPATDRVVFMTPEDEAPYRKLVQALEGARSAGASSLGMVAEPVAASAAAAAAAAAAPTLAPGTSTGK